MKLSPKNISYIISLSQISRQHPSTFIVACRFLCCFHLAQGDAPYVAFCSSKHLKNQGWSSQMFIWLAQCLTCFKIKQKYTGYDAIQHLYVYKNDTVCKYKRRLSVCQQFHPCMKVFLNTDRNHMASAIQQLLDIETWLQMVHYHLVLVHSVCVRV